MGIPYPGTLPTNFQTQGYKETGADNQIRSQMDVGPQKVRRRTTANVRKITGQFFLTPAQYTTFKTFYETDTSYGVTPFDFTDPHGNTNEYRFVKPPVYSPNGNVEWLVRVEWEQLP